ncbi:MAG: thioredoxin [Deltaproteobacteria bacterium HGW-Deltaproteobacteria-6]|nr:MAG: thioredoxin [Deltaproteobacteria bacterium HGW-Deltaproteobacteria-6]
MGILALLTIAAFTFTALDYSRAFAQNRTGKSAAAKASNQTGVKAGKVLVTFVEIGAARCIPCKAMQPIMKAVEEEYQGQVKVVFHDVWTQQGRMDAEKYHIRMIPTQVFLDKDGKEYFRHEGYFPKDDLVSVLKKQGVK